MGGGGFSQEPDNLRLDRYVLAAAGKPRPRVCFVPTASGDSVTYAEKFYKAFRTLDCEPSHLALFAPPGGSLRDYVFSKDVIYVGGGNTRNLMVLWQEWDLDTIFREAWDRGIVLAGVSAGANCWFEECVTDSIPGDLTWMKCLGFLPGSFCPHYDGESNRRPSFRQMVASGALKPGIACDDGCAVHYVDTRQQAIVSSRPNAKAYYLTREENGEAQESVFEPTFLQE
jgi:peptidase E